LVFQQISLFATAGMEACVMEPWIAPVRAVSLRGVLPSIDLVAAHDVRVRRCCWDAARCRPGDLFVLSSSTEPVDLAMVRAAIAGGAVAILADRPVLRAEVPVGYVDDLADASGRIVQALAGHPAKKLKLIGVAGGLGRTVASYLIANVLENGSFRPGMLGTLGGFDGMLVESDSQMALNQSRLAGWLARMNRHDCTHAIIELSTAALRRGLLGGIELELACLAGEMSVATGGRHQQVASARLLSHVAADGVAVLNTDGAQAAELLWNHQGPVLSIGMESDAQISATVVERTTSDQTFLLSAGRDMVPVRTPILGDQGVWGCLAATAVGLVHGLPLTEIVRSLETVQRMPSCLERVECGQPFSVFIDRAAQSRPLAAALQALRGLNQGRLICVCSAEDRLSRAACAALGKAAARADLVIYTGSPRDGAASADNAGNVLAGIAPPGEVEVIPHRQQAIHHALSLAKAGDCVLIAGGGQEAWPILSGRSYTTDDRDTARRWLYASAATVPAP
jgi:UDP-N-acetylmuramoyl-L-alanyl-D-glutamate--2,6-diaminopimelate ligase